MAQLEFILTILTILFVIFWLWELVMVVYTMNVLSDAAKEGVRFAIVRGSGGGLPGRIADPGPIGPCPGGNNCDVIANVVRDYASYSLHDISDPTRFSVTVTHPPDGVGAPSNDAPNRVRVEIAYSFVPYTTLPILPLLRAAAEGRIVN